MNNGIALDIAIDKPRYQPLADRVVSVNGSAPPRARSMNVRRRRYSYPQTTNTPTNNLINNTIIQAGGWDSKRLELTPAPTGRTDDRLLLSSPVCLRNQKLTARANRARARKSSFSFFLLLLCPARPRTLTARETDILIQLFPFLLPLRSARLKPRSTFECLAAENSGFSKLQNFQSVSTLFSRGLLTRVGAKTKWCPTI